MFKGIDVSMHNGTIDFNTAKNGIQAVIIKATEGVDYVDPLFEQHYNGACGKGFSIGFYHFMSEKTDPAQQAQDFYNAIKDKEYNIIPVLDIEVNNLGRNKTEITDRCLKFLVKFKELSGHYCMIYTYTSFANESLDNRLVNYPLWLAEYDVQAPHSNSVWGNNYAGWQYTSTGSVPGVNGNVDVNNFNESIFIGNAPQAVSVQSKSSVDSWVAELQAECNRQGFSCQTVDGIPGKNTLAGCPLLKVGAQGNITRLLQIKLGITADSIFGEQTRQAVITFQRAHGLTPDGVVGQNTWRALLGI